MIKFANETEIVEIPMIKNDLFAGLVYLTNDFGEAEVFIDAESDYSKLTIMSSLNHTGEYLVSMTLSDGR